MSRAKSYGRSSGLQLRKPKTAEIPVDTSLESREPNRSIKNELPHLVNLHKLEKFELRKKLEKLGVDEAVLSSMTFNQMQVCYSNMVEES